MRLRNLHCLLAGLIFLFAAHSLGAQTCYYVDVNNGSDLNPGTSPGAAFQTVNFAISVAVAGDTINVMPGTYTEEVVVDKDGLSIEAYPTALFTPPAGGMAFEVDSSLEPITNATIIRGFDIDGQMNGGDGIVCHNDLSLSTDFDISPIIENNKILNCSQGITFQFDGLNAVCAPIVQHNFVDVEGGSCSAPIAFGIWFNPRGGATMDAFVRSNEVYRTEFGIGVWNQGFGIENLSSQCNTISKCEWGILISGGIDSAVFVNETVAFGNPASFGQTMQGIEVDSPNVEVYNSIVWIPDDNNCNGLQGVDLVGFGAGGATIDAESIVLDLGDPAPMFLDPTPGVWDFRLAPGSPGIDAGNTALVASFGPFPVEYDNRGVSRILASNFDHTMEVDVGAHEFTELTFEVTDNSFPGYTGNGEFYVNTLLGGNFDVTITGPANGLAYLIYGRDRYNRYLPSLGNMLVPLGFLVGPVALSTGPATWNLSWPNISSLKENPINFQGVVLVPFAGGGPRTGNFTRHVVVELNE